jgi:hypothetical protein
MKRNPYVREGLQKAGFTGGWLEPAAGPDVKAEPLPAESQATSAKNSAQASPPARTSTPAPADKPAKAAGPSR